MENIKDSNFVNLATSIDAIQRKLSTPKKRGVRANHAGDAQLDEDLRVDMVKVLTSPLQQKFKLEPLPGLSAAQVEGMRALYAVLSDESNPGEDLEAVLEAAVELLDPSATPSAEEATVVDQRGFDDTTSGLSMVRRSTRIAQLPKMSYSTQMNADDLRELLDGAESESDGEEMNDEVEIQGEEREAEDELENDGTEGGMDSVESKRKEVEHEPDEYGSGFMDGIECKGKEEKHEPGEDGTECMDGVESATRSLPSPVPSGRSVLEKLKARRAEQLRPLQG